MSERDNNMRGVLFANDKQREGKKDPTHTGQCEVEHVGYWIDAWVNQTQDGRRYFRLSFTPKKKPEPKPAPKPAEVPVVNPLDFDDSIPF